MKTATHRGQRLASLTIGGWDPGSGVEVPSGPQPPANVDGFLAMAEKGAPHLTAWVTADVKPGLQACWLALRDRESAAALEALGVPILLWAGKDDACYEGAEKLAGALAHARFLGVPGDHLAARRTYVDESATGLRSFLDSL